MKTLLTIAVFALAIGASMALINTIARSRSTAEIEAAVEREAAGDAIEVDAIEVDAINRTPLKLPLASPRIIVKKAERRLLLYSNQKVVRRWRIGLGTKPRGDKRKEGDRRTPEGTFYICRKNPNSQYYLSLGISYPAPDDARRGLRSRLITQAQHDAIVEAHQEKECPLWNTPLGGEVFIHGNGSQSDWTWGCVALDDDAMKELYDAVPTGTAVTIKP